MISNNKHSSIKILSVFSCSLLLSSCAFSFSVPFINTEPSGPEPLTENTIESLNVAPETVPSTNIPSASLEQAKMSYLKLLNSTNSAELKAESLQRLSEIESMIAENYLDQDNEELMKQHLNLAADYYQRLLDNHADLIEQSKVQYQLARVLGLLEKPVLANEILDNLAKLKGSEFEIVEARFRMAETAYSAHNYAQALKLYRQVIEHENDPNSGKINSFYNTALFKLGWTEFKRQNYDLAVESFIALLDIIYADKTLTTNTEQSLINETYRVSALSLSYLEGAESLESYLMSNKPYAADLYLALAELYLHQQRFQDTANTYFGFVKLNPNSAQAPKFEDKGIKVLGMSGFVDLVLQAKENFIEHYKTGADYWLSSDLQGTGFQRTTEVSTWLYNNLDDVINFHHAQAQKTKKPMDYLVSAKWYRVFLNSFDSHPRLNDKRWLLAETLNDAGEIEGSIKEYQILAYQTDDLENSKKEEAAYRVILGRQSQYNHSPKIDDLKEKRRQALIETGLRYQSQFGLANTSTRAAEILSSTTELLLEAGQTANAIVQARVMGTLQSATGSHNKRAREIIANGEFDLKHYQLAEQAFGIIFNKDEYSPSKLKTFHERRAQSIFKQAEASRAEGKVEQSIEHYLRIGSLEPKAKVRVKADFEAALLLLEIKLYRRAIVVLKAFNKQFPAHQLSKSIPAKLIVAYEALEDWQGAAEQYSGVAKTTNDETLARTATWQAATSWMKIDNVQSKNTAVAIWKKYIKQYPKPFDLSLEARNKLIDLYSELGVKWKQDFWRRKIILVVDTNKLKDVRSRTLAAQSQMSLVNDIFTQYQEVKLTQPLSKSLKKKRTQLKTSLKGFSKVLDYKIQLLSTEAGHRIGEAYAGLAQAIMTSTRPKGMSDIELEEYDSLLEERVYPIEDQAIAAFEAHVSQTSKGVWNKWIRASFKQLEILMPGRYQKSEVIDDYQATP